MRIFILTIFLFFLNVGMNFVAINFVGTDLQVCPSLSFSLSNIVFSQDNFDSSNVQISSEGLLNQTVTSTELISKPFNISADYLAYSVDDNILTATGNIAVEVGGIQINADSLQLSLNSRFLQAQGKVVIKSTFNQQNIITLQGDALKFDFNTTQGSLYKVEENVEVTYFIGEGLNIISTPIDNLKENIEVPDLTRAKLSIVAKRMRIVFGDKFEAWKVSFWVKGTKAMSIPYYTTSVENTFENVELPFAIRGLDYSSKNRFKISGSAYYIKSAKNKGQINFDYYSVFENSPDNREKSKWKTNLQQHFTLGQKKGIDINVTNLGEKNYSGSLNYNHFFNDYFEGNFNFSYYPNSSASGFLQFLFRGKDSDTRIALSKQRGVHNDSENKSFYFNWALRPQFIKNSKVGFYFALSYNHTITKPSKLQNYNFNFNTNIFKSAILITKTIFANFSTNFSQNLGKNLSSTNISTNISFTKKISLSTFFTTTYYKSYTITENKSAEKNYLQNDNATLSLSSGKSNLWNTSTALAYNIRTKKALSLSPALDLKLSKLLRTNLYSVYYFSGQKKWQNVQLNMYYNIFGADDNRRLQFFWDFKKKEYLLSFNAAI